MNPYIRLKQIGSLGLITNESFKLSIKFSIEYGSFGELQTAEYSFRDRSWSVDDRSLSEYLKYVVNLNSDLRAMLDLMLETFCHNVVANSEKILADKTKKEELEEATFEIKNIDLISEDFRDAFK